MTEIIVFIAGVFVGTILGVLILALCQANGRGADE